MNDITKPEAMRLLGLKTDTEFAAWFRDQPTKQAAGAWGDGPLPDGRQWELRARRPDLFGPVSDQPEPVAA